MKFFLFKLFLTAFIIAGVSEISKRYIVLGTLLASLPITSILTMTWIYYETSDTEKIIQFSNAMVWLVLPASLFFIALPFLLKQGVNFYIALGMSCILMMMGYSTFVFLKKMMG